MSALTYACTDTQINQLGIVHVIRTTVRYISRSSAATIDSIRACGVFWHMDEPNALFQWRPNASSRLLTLYVLIMHPRISPNYVCGGVARPGGLRLPYSHHGRCCCSNRLISAHYRHVTFWELYSLGILCSRRRCVSKPSFGASPSLLCCNDCPLSPKRHAT